MLYYGVLFSPTQDARSFITSNEYKTFRSPGIPTYRWWKKFCTTWDLGCIRPCKSWEVHHISPYQLVIAGFLNHEQYLHLLLLGGASQSMGPPWRWSNPPQRTLEIHPSSIHWIRGDGKDISAIQRKIWRLSLSCALEVNHHFKNDVFYFGWW